MILFTKYSNKKDCPFISRVHGNEISLMTEIVNDNETRDMFPAQNSTKTFKKRVIKTVKSLPYDETTPEEIASI